MILCTNDPNTHIRTFILLEFYLTAHFPVNILNILNNYDTNFHRLKKMSIRFGTYGKAKHELRVTGSNLRVPSSNLRVTSSG